MNECLNQVQGFFSLFDKYLKSNDQTLFETYLKYLETPVHNNLATKSPPTKTKDESNNACCFKDVSFNQEESSFFCQLLNDSKNELLIAQKTYKFLIIIDYSEASTLLSIELALYKIIEKISNEYDRLQNLCKFEPTIYLTVISWHPKYFKHLFNQPFSIIIHSKYLFKNSFRELASKIYKIFTTIIKNLKTNRDEEKRDCWNQLSNKLIKFKQNNYLKRNFLQTPEKLFEEQQQQQYKANRHQSQQQLQQQPQFNDFEKLLFYATKIFNFFPDSNTLIFSNIIYINDSILQTTDITKQTDFLSYFGVKLSFVYIGIQTSYSCGFGLKANYYYMKYLARITNGFYAHINEASEFEIVEDNPVLDCYKQNHNIVDNIIVSGTNEDSFEFESFEDTRHTTTATTSSTPGTSVGAPINNFYLNLKHLAVANDSNYCEYYYNKKSRLNSSNHDRDCIMIDDVDHETDPFNKKYKTIRHQQLNTKCLFKYEIQRDLFELIRTRLRDGFKLIKCCNLANGNNTLISIYLIRYFTHTTVYLYKISYSVTKKKQLNIELWRITSYLNTKINCNNLMHSAQIASFINNLQNLDIDCRLDMSVNMLTVPDKLLQSKESLLKRAPHKTHNYFYRINKDLRRLHQKSDVDSNDLNTFAHQWYKLALYELNYEQIDRYYHNHQIDFFFNLNAIEIETIHTKLIEMFKEWSNVILVDNIVFLKYLRSSLKYKSTPLYELEKKRNIDNYYSNNYDSFVIVSLNLRHLPYCSIKYTFHLNITNSDSKLIIEKHKNLIDNLFTQHESYCLLYPLKPDICSQLEKIIFPDDYLFFKNIKQFETNLDLLNYMHQQKYYWSISIESLNNIQQLNLIKQTIIDIFINTRSNEGFKQLFKTKDFILMMIELDLSDDGAYDECVLNVSENKTPHKSLLHNYHHAGQRQPPLGMEPLNTSSPIKNLNQPTSSTGTQQNPHTQKASLIYVLRFLNDDENELSSLSYDEFGNTYENSILFSQNDSQNEQLFITEIYIETINGTCELSRNNKSNLKYFNGLNYNQIVNLIYLIDLKEFLTLQSVYSLLFAQNNNFSQLLSKHCLSKENENLLENRIYKNGEFLNEFKKVEEEGGMNFYYNSGDYESSHGIEINKETKENLLGELADFRHLIVKFEFTFAELLRESMIICCVYDDIPISLVKSNADYLVQMNKIFSATLLNLFKNENFEFISSLNYNSDYEQSESATNILPTTPKTKLNKKLSETSVVNINSYLNQNLKKILISRLRELHSKDQFIKDLITMLQYKIEINLSSSPSPDRPKFNYFLKLCNKKNKNSLCKEENQDQQLVIFAYCFLDYQNGPSHLVTFIIDLSEETIKKSLKFFKNDTYIIRKNLLDSPQLHQQQQQQIDGDSMKIFENQNFYENLKIQNDYENLESSTVNNHQEDMRCTNLSKLLSLKTNLKENNNILLFSDFVEKICTISYLNSVLSYLGTLTTTTTANVVIKSTTMPQATTNESIQQQNVTITEEMNKANCNREGICKLLKIAKKKKITDIDLTDYLYSLCDEFKELNTCCNNLGNDLCKRISLISESDSNRIKSDDKDGVSVEGKLEDENKILKSESASSNTDDDNDELNESESDVEIHINEDNKGIEDDDDEVFQKESKQQQQKQNTKQNCSNSNKLKYFEEKFKKTILDKFNLLPGFNDLFVIIPSKSNDQFEFDINDESVLKSSSSSLSSSQNEKSKQQKLKNPQNNLDFYKNRIVRLKYIIEVNEVRNSLTTSATASLSSFSNEIMTSTPPLTTHLFQQQMSRSNKARLSIIDDNDFHQNNNNDSKNLLTIERNFSKFNLTCILNLISENDFNNIKNIIFQCNKNLKQNNIKANIEIKVYLRFNTYLFTDIINNKSTSPIALLMRPPSPSQGFLMPQTTAITTTINLSPTNINNNNTSQKGSINSQENSDYYNELYLSIAQFKWYLNDEILQKREILANLNDFNQYIQHVLEGIKRKCIHCEHKLKDITFSNLTNTSPSQLNNENSKFKQEFLDLIQKLDGHFYNCKLQKLDDYNYYLNCDKQQQSGSFNNDRTLEADSNHDDADDEIKSTFKILIHVNDNNSTLSIKTSNQQQNYLSTKSSPRTPSPIISPIPISTSNTTPIKQTQSLHDISNSGVTQPTSTSAITTSSKISSSSPHSNVFGLDSYQRQRQRLQQQKQQQQQQQQQQAALNINNNIKIEIYFSFNHFTFAEDSIQTLATEFYDKLENLINSVYLKLILKNIDDTKKWNNCLQLSNDSLITNFNFQQPIQSQSVWSHVFRLHRLQQLPHTNIPNQTPISFGLQKLKVSFLENFKIYDSTFGDTYVYEDDKDMYLLTLKEIENQSPHTPVSAATTIAASSSLTNAIDNEHQDNLVHDETTSSLNSSHSIDEIHQQNSTGVTISRRTSYIGDDSKLKTSGGGNSGGSITNIYSSKPDLIKLSLFGLTEPSNQFKDNLIKKLQTDLDCCLIEKFWLSIDKNNYKTSSAQHPDKILDEDIIFMKNISDSYFDEEIQIPSIFNLNKQLRELFFYYIRFILNTNFKAMDVSYNQQNILKTQRIQENNQSSGEIMNYSPLISPMNALDDLQTNIIFQPSLKHLQPVVTVLSQKLSFSFVAYDPPLGQNLINQTSQSDEILLSRIFPHNSKCRIGKHTSLSLSLVECVYVPKGFDKIIKSTIIKPQTTTPPQQSHIETLVSKCMKFGPTIGFKYYSRGENEQNSMQGSLKQAINQALLIFFCDYLTKVDSEFYMKKIELNSIPTKIRQNESDGSTLQQQQPIDAKSYQEVIECLREMLIVDKQFEYNKIFNDLIKNKLLLTGDEEKPSYKKTYLKLIYEWLFTLYHSYRFSQVSPPPQQYNQQNPNIFSRSNSVPVQQTASTLSVQANASSNSNLNPINLIYRKEFVYRTRSNLINLVQDFLTNLKEICKLEVTMNYFTFKNKQQDREDIENFLFNDETINSEFNNIDDFENLKQTSFKNLENDLIKKENLIIIFNVDYSQQQQPQQQQGIKTNSYLHHVPSVNSLPSLSRQPGSLITSIHSSNDFIQMQQRIFCYTLVDSKKKCIYFYAFTNENSVYNNIKQSFETLCDVIYNRTILINNIVVFKFGGLIGDHMMVDIKNLKMTQLQTTQQPLNETPLPQSHPILVKTQSDTQSQRNSNWKVSKSPTTTSRQFIFPQKQEQQQQQQQLITTTQQTTPQSITNISNFNIKQFYMNIKENRSYESMSNLINQQLLFYSQSFHSSATILPSLAIHLNMAITPSSEFHNAVSQFGLSSSINSSLKQSSNRLNFSSNPGFIYGVGFNYHIQEANQIFRHPRKIYEVATSAFGDQINIITDSTATTTTPQHKPQSQHSINDFYKNTVVPVLHPFHYCCSPVLFFPDWADKIVTESSLKTSLTNSITSASSQIDLSNLNSNQELISSTKVVSNIPVADAWYRKMRQIFLAEYSRHFTNYGFMRLKDERKYSGSNDHDSNSSLTHFIKWIHQDGFIYITLNFDDIFLHVKFGFCPRYRSSTRLFFNEINRLIGKEFHFHSASYDYHLVTINRNFQSANSYASNSLVQTPNEFQNRKPTNIQTTNQQQQQQQSSSIIQSAISLQTLMKFLDEFFDYFMTKCDNNLQVSKLPNFSVNKIYKDTFEKPDCSLIPKKIGIVFDYILNRKQDATSFLPIHTNLENNIGIYLATNQENQRQFASSATSLNQSTPTNNDLINNNQEKEIEYMKYLIVKIENYTSKQCNEQNLMGSSIITSSATLSNSSSSSSLVGLAKAGSNTQQKQKNQQQSETSSGSGTSSVRLVWYYLCVNKNFQVVQQNQLISKRFESSINQMNETTKILNDLGLVKQIIEDSINIYKREIFWDNLIIAIQHTPLQQTNTSLYSIEFEELEYILKNSYKINALELQSMYSRSLKTLFEQGYSIKEKICGYLQSTFGKHYIFVSSPKYDYCLLILTKSLISKIKVESQPYRLEDINSFILVKFNKDKGTMDLMQVNRMQNQDQQIDIIKPKIENIVATNIISSSVSSTSSLTTSSSAMTISQLALTTNSNNNGIKISYENLNFIINTFVYIIFENILRTV